jgi:hypothetical protein
MHFRVALETDIAAGSEPCPVLSVCVAPESELVKLMEGKSKPEGDVIESGKKRLNLLARSDQRLPSAKGRMSRAKSSKKIPGLSLTT